MEKKIEISDTSRVRVDWYVNPMDSTKEDENSIRALMAKKYDIEPSKIKIQKISTKQVNKDDGGLNETDAINIQDPKFQQELFKQYIEQNEITDIDFNEIVKIDSRINSLMDYDKYEKSKRYQIKWVDWSNFLSYGKNNHFDFTQLSGLVQLNGEPANESGKSTFAYDLLHFLLFGKINQDRAKTNDQLFNNYTDDNEVVVEGCISIDGEDYIIKRTLTRKAKGKSASQKIQYYKLLGNGITQELNDTENAEESTTTQTNKVIKEALGNEKDFDLIISANAKDLDDLISMGETDRGKLLTKWIGLSPLEDKEAKAKEIYKNEVAKGRFCDIYNTVSLNSDIENFTNEITECKSQIKQLETKSKDATNELEALNKEKDDLLTKKQEIDKSVLNLDAKTLETKINNIIETGKNNKLKLESEKSKLQEIGEVDFDKEEYSVKVKSKESIIESIATAKALISSLEKENKNLSSLEYCPTCGKKFDNVDNSAKISENEAKISENNKTLENLNIQRENIISEISSMDKKRELAELKSKISLKIVALNSEITDGRLEYKENKDLLDKLNQNREAIIKNNQIDTQVNTVKASIVQNESIIRNCSYDIATYNKSVDHSEEKIRDCKSKIVRIEEEKKLERIWKIYLQMIGKDGIGKMVLRHALPIINNELHSLLSDSSDFEVEVSVNDSNAVEFWLIRDDVKTRLSAASGLEKTQAALALRVVLGKMSRLSCPPFILLDEILGTVAAENYDKMKSLYDKIVPLYDFVLHITHLNLDGWHDMTLTVKKENNISSVKPLVLK